MGKRVKYPNQRELTSLFVALRSDIGDEYRASEEDTEPSMCVTLGFTPEDGSWDFQTGDNSYTGGAYLHPDWAVVSVYRDSNARELAKEVVEQLAQLHW